jgi:hypothetical protein
MDDAASLTIARALKWIPHVALCCALAMLGNANAQSMDAPLAPPMDPYSQGMLGGSVPPGSNARGIFVGTIAAILAQSLGSGIGAALSQGIGGSITRWFRADPQADADSRRLDPSPAGLQAGMAYEVHLIASNGESRAVDPARHVFRTGDRFRVYYRPTLPGRVEVTNLNPQGKASRIDDVEVAAGQLASLGPYRFVGEAGDETLTLALAPCTSAKLAATTRNIARVGGLPDPGEPALGIQTCQDAKTRGMRVKTRSIDKATMDGATAFAMDPLTDEEVATGVMAARAVRIRLQHR